MSDPQNKPKFEGQKISDAICIIPFISLSVNAGGYVSRCQMSEKRMGLLGQGQSLMELWNGEKLQALRASMKDGIWDEGCSSCKSKEDLGIKSKRQHWMKLKLAEDLWRDPKVFELGKREDLFHVDIAFSNYCNFRCRMCGPGYSSRWVADDEALKQRGLKAGSGGQSARTSSLVFTGPGKSLSDKELESLAIKMKKVRRIEVLGGEPFLTREFLEFLKLCREHGVSDKAELMVTTNGSVLTPELLELLDPFYYVNLNISVDATDAYFSYMRSAGACDWSRLNANVMMALDFCDRKSQSSNRRWKVNLNGTFQAYNMLNIDHFLSWIESLYKWSSEPPGDDSKYRHSFEHRILMGPRHLSVLNAPRSLVEESLRRLQNWLTSRPYIREIDEWGYIRDILKTLEAALHKSDEDKGDGWAMFCWYTELLDEIRGESLEQVDPILSAQVERTKQDSLYQDKVKEWRGKPPAAQRID